MKNEFIFENLECWKMAREEANLIYKHFGNCRDYAFRDQIIRAIISVMNNIAEGYGRWSTKEKIQFMNMANGSLFEVRSMLYLSLDQKYIPLEIGKELLAHNGKTTQILQGYLRHLHSSKSTSPYTAQRIVVNP